MRCSRREAAWATVESDPELTGTAAVVLDEVHERALDTDLLLGMLATTAIGVDDDVGEGFSGDEESRCHRVIIAGFAGRGEHG